MKQQCSEHRTLVNTKKAFVRCTNTHNWDEAKRCFPSFANESRLTQFLHLSFTKGAPEVFCDYCQAALNSTNVTPVDCYTIIKNGATGYVLQPDSMAITAARVREAVASYQGANIIVAHIPQVSLYQIY